MTISFKKIALIVLAVVFIGSIAFVANAQSAPLDLAKATLKLEAKSTQYRLKSAGERVKPQMKREYEIVTTVEQTEVVTLEQSKESETFNLLSVLPKWIPAMTIIFSLLISWGGAIVKFSNLQSQVKTLEAKIEKNDEIMVTLQIDLREIKTSLKFIEEKVADNR